MLNAVTLNPGTPNVTLTGSIDAYGPAGTYGRFHIAYQAALFAPAGKTFTINNTGLIESFGTGTSTYGIPVDIGILLGAAGTIINDGTIIGARGIDIFGTAAGALVDNASLVEASLSAGIVLHAAGIIDNTGTIDAPHLGIDFVYADGTVNNSGLISATLGYGLGSRGAGGTVTNTGTIAGYSYGIFFYSSAASVPNIITNAGLIEALAKPLVDSFAKDAILEIGGGTISNLATGTIADPAGFGVDVLATAFDPALGKFTPLAAAVDNAGTIIAADGVYFNGIGTITNTGKIFANEAGAEILTSLAAVDNSGFIEAAGTMLSYDRITFPAAAIIATKNGAITNAATGTITAPNGDGIVVLDGGFLLNAGRITGGRDGLAASAAYLKPATLTAAYVSLTNAATGTIQGAENGILYQGGGGPDSFGDITIHNAGIILSPGDAINIEGASTFAATLSSALYNSGCIVGGSFGVFSTYGSTAIHNEATGRITGSTGILAHTAQIENAGTISASGTGIIITAGGTILNSGLIIGSGGAAISFTAGFTNLLELTPAATLAGKIDVNGALDLQAGPTPGKLNAAALQNISALTIDPGATWQFANKFTTTAPLTNYGTLNDHGALTFDGAITGTGLIALAAHKLTLAGPVAATQTLSLTGTNEILALADPTGMAAQIDHFTPADTIDLTTIPRARITGETFAAGILTLAESTSKISLTFANPKSFKGETFALFTDATGTGITLTGAAALSPTPAAYKPSEYRPAALSLTPIQPLHTGWLSHNLTTPTSVPQFTL